LRIYKKIAYFISKLHFLPAPHTLFMARTKHAKMVSSASIIA